MEWFTWLFGGDEPPHPLGVGHAFARAIFVYAVGILIVRMGKVRLLGRASVLDILLAFTIGSVLSRAVNGSSSMSAAFVATAAMVIMHRVLTELSLNSHRLGKLIKGDAIRLVEDGKILEDNMRRANISIHDLVEEIRLNSNLGSAEEVKEAFLERNGEIGVVKRKG